MQAGAARRALAWVMAVACAFVAGASPAVASPAGAAGVWPLGGPVVTGFDPPDVRWGAGHRGVDVAGSVGEVVVSPSDGVVTFAGDVAGRPVVVITHDDRRSTFEPVVASVAVGTAVRAGDPIGTLAAGHACPAEACLHWGLRRGETYLDPLSLVAAAEVRLLGEDAAGAVTRRARAREAEAAALASAVGPVAGSGVLAQPTAGRLGSRFGMRFHPIFHEWRMHNGVDLSNSCGTPLVAAADGVVSHMGFDASGGWRLVIDHGGVNGAALQTVYLHAQGYRVRPGDRVGRGQLVGSMGSTGWSTGCHLHFSVKANGRHVDPLGWLAGG